MSRDTTKKERKQKSREKKSGDHNYSGIKMQGKMCKDSAAILRITWPRCGPKKGSGSRGRLGEGSKESAIARSNLGEIARGERQGPKSARREGPILQLALMKRGMQTVYCRSAPSSRQDRGQWGDGDPRSREGCRHV